MQCFNNVKFNTNEVTNMNTMLQRWNKLEYLDLSNFNTSKVIDMTYMTNMFTNCLKLKEVKGINEFNVNEITNMNAMLQSCNELEYLDLSCFYASKVKDVRFMFTN